MRKQMWCEWLLFACLTVAAEAQPGAAPPANAADQHADVTPDVMGGQSDRNGTLSEPPTAVRNNTAGPPFGGDSENPRAGVERLVRRLETTPVDEVWWNSAQALLDRLTARDALRLLDGFEEGGQKQALRALVRARFELTPAQLKKAQNSTLFPQVAKAARHEWQRRLNRDPSVKLISQVFHLRPELAAIQEDGIRKALDHEDETAAATGIAALFDSVGRDGKAKLSQEISEIENDPGLADSPDLQRLVKRLRWTLEETNNKKRGTSTVENRFKDALETAFGKAEEDVKHFHELLDKAAAGDAKALEQLRKEYGEQGLLDFMAAHPEDPTADKLAQALGWRDKDGNVHLDVKQGGGSETWDLGAKPETIRQSLRDFINASGLADHQSGIELAQPPSPSDRRFVRIDPATHLPAAEEPGFRVPEDASVCRIPGPPLIREIPLQRRPNYFFRPFPDSDSGSYAGTDENFLVDFGDGTLPPQEYKLPGFWDPVPTPDERYMTVPTNHKDIKGLTFFPMDQMRRPPYGKQKPLYEDKQMVGVYQSLGIVDKGDGGAATYRAIVADKKGILRVRDYTIKPDPSQPGGARVTPHGDAPKVLCNNMPDVELSLPMISKNGRQISAVDVKAGVTKIYNLADDGSCTEDINLGIFTGKVDFGYDNDTLTFHVFNNEQNALTYIDVPSDTRVANVYVYKRSTRQMIRLTNNTDANAIYPAFRRDGSIVFLQHPHGAAGDNPEKSKLVIVDPKRYDSTLFDHFTPGDAEAGGRLKKLTALGLLWAQVCSTDSHNISRQSAVLDTLSLDRDRCWQLVGKYWESGKAKIFSRALPNLKEPPESLQALTRADLESVCRADAAPPPTPTPVTPPTGNPGRDPADILERCIDCHNLPGMPKVPFTDPEALKTQQTTTRQLLLHLPPTSLADDIKRRIADHDFTPGHRMPPGEQLKPSEVEALLKYMKLSL